MHEKRVSSGLSLARFISNYNLELEGLTRQRVQKESVTGGWRKPIESTIKINFDGAFRVSTFYSASGIVARDSDANVLASKSPLANNVPSGFAVDALACLHAIEMGLDQRWADVIIEGDAMKVIKKCMSKSRDKSLLSAYVSDIHGLKTGFQSIEFCFTPRKSNRLAHIIATESLKRNEELYLNDELPRFAEESVGTERVIDPG